ncbi:SusC/RagA family TonB-linked outer membrane protein [Rhizosphaericola mali]|nr:TonB-dependent receptor [Rhizosphaericola mali]
MESAVNSIAKKANIRLVYEKQIWKNTGYITVSFKNVTLKSILDKIFENTSVIYETINDQFIVLKTQNRLNNTSFIDNTKTTKINQSGFLIEGTVVDEQNTPLSGVNIRVKDGSQSAISNERGYYNIGISKPGVTLIFSFVGYQTKEQVVYSMSTLNETMQSDPANLDAIVVIGYGTTTKRLSTGAQSGIGAVDIAKQPVTNVLQALEGRLPGVFITQTNGLPGAGINVQIRGSNSLSKSNRPLYIIDGIPYLSSPINTATGTSNVLPSAEGNTSPLNTINPADIENIEVLKDADATAIYGSRGANGVVLITTKKGKEGNTKFNATISNGISKVAHFVPMLGLSEYLRLRELAFSNGSMPSSTPTNTTAPDLTLWDTTQSTDWQKKLLGNTAHTFDATSSISGGNRQTNFYLSGTYHREGNVFPGSQHYERGGMNLNLNHSSNDQRFNLNFTAMYSADKNNITTTDLAGYAYSLPPNFPLYNNDGSLYWLPGTIGSLPNPLGYLNQTNDNKTSNLMGNLGLKYTIVKGLDVKSSFGYSKTDMDQTTLRPLTSLSAAYSVPTSGTSSFSYNYTNNYIVEPQITYHSEFGKNEINLLAGGTYQYSKSRQPYYILASGFASDDFLTNISSATSVSTYSSSQDYKYTSVLGRINYNYNRKYIANFNIRRDGSSRFGPNNKFGNFGSLGAAWLFSEESLLKNNIHWLSFGKLRGSYGIVGSDDIGNYQYLETYSTYSYVYNGVSGLNPTRIANSNFKWEETRKLEIGLELGFLKDRISINTSYYRNRTSNQLLNFPLSSQTGFTTYQSNLPAKVQNAGWEFSLNSTNIKKKEFSWTTSFNISRNRNKLLSFPNIENTSYYSSYVVGNPITAYYLYQFAGIDPSTNLPSFTSFLNGGTTGSPTTGLVATKRGDRYYVGTSLPSFFGGLTNSITYKNLSLDFTFQFVKQKGRSLASASYYPPGYLNNMSSDVVNNYLGLGNEYDLVTAGLSTTKGRAAYRGYSYYTGSDATVVDASFIRMKNISLSYTLPNALLKKINSQMIRIFVQGQNIFTITKYKGFDPESQGVVTPPLRTIVTGIQLTF